jgi:hypothetical protein
LLLSLKRVYLHRRIVALDFQPRQTLSSAGGGKLGPASFDSHFKDVKQEIERVVADNQRGLFVLAGQVCRLAMLKDRIDRPHLGEDRIDPLIDQLHRATALWQQERRPELVQYLHGHDLGDHAGFWRLAQALFEVLPHTPTTGSLSTPYWTNARRCVWKSSGGTLRWWHLLTRAGSGEPVSGRWRPKE